MDSNSFPQKLFYHDLRLGVLGGGQLGRMFLRSALDFNVWVAVLDPAANAPSRRYCHHFTQADFRDPDAVLAFGRDLDVLTIEIEDVSAAALAGLQAQGKRVFPQPEVIALVQDKATQKDWLLHHGFPTLPFVRVDDPIALRTLVTQPEWALPVVQKLRRGGFDGRGVHVLRLAGDLQRAFSAPSILEPLCSIQRELSVLVARNALGQVATYPLVEQEFNPEANVVEFLFSPSTLPPALVEEATELGQAIAEALGIVGLLAVELFLDSDDRLWVNELAPRLHNSGHHTLGACHTSQFEQHLRAVLGLPLGSPALKMPAVMVNILGAPGHSGPPFYEGIEDVLATPGVRLHLYGKAETRPHRKMGHLTVLAPTLAEAKATARQCQSRLRVLAR
jgi:5-(carboxyamino)imidazole ribonucleotide synthase